jgi:nitrogen fixation protein FixH
MSDWLLSLPVLWMGLVILGAIYVFTAGLYWLITALAVGERARAFKGISPGMLPPLSVVFALLIGFLAAQVWNDADRASTAVNREASALRAAVLLAAAFPGEPETHLRDLIRGYIQDAVTQEWPAMARRNATLTIVPARLSEALRLAFSLTPRGDGQVAAQREMIGSLQIALEARRQRIILSGSSINWVKWIVLLVQAGLTLLTIAMVHSDNRAANRIILTIFATAVGVAVVLIASQSRPFSGEIAVHPTVLLQVMPEAGPAVASP